jgi:hypothetical protein
MRCQWHSAPICVLARIRRRRLKLVHSAETFRRWWHPRRRRTAPRAQLATTALAEGAMALPPYTSFPPPKTRRPNTPAVAAESGAYWTQGDSQQITRKYRRRMCFHLKVAVAAQNYVKVFSACRHFAAAAWSRSSPWHTVTLAAVGYEGKFGSE